MRVAIRMINPIISKNLLQERDIIAKYSLRDAITNKTISKLIHLILDTIKIKENLPINLIKKYNEKEYIRNYDEFIKMVKKSKSNILSRISTKPAS